jgi:hypothetical protein
MLTALQIFNIIIDSVFAACLAVYFVEVVKLHSLAPFKKRKPVGLAENIGVIFNRKPFTCATCLSSWVGLNVGILKYPSLSALYPMFLAGILGLLLTKLINR